MPKQILITIICAVLGAIVLLGLGYSAGYFAVLTSEKGKTELQIEQLEKAADALKTLSSSKVISCFAVLGEVTKIDGRDITLKSTGDSLTIHIKEDAKVYSSAKNGSFGTGATSSVQQQVEFKDIKKGDFLNIGVKLLPDGQLEGQVINILPVFTNK